MIVPLVLRLMRDRVASEVVGTFRGWIHRVAERNGGVRAVKSRTSFSLSAGLTRALMLTTGNKVLSKVSADLRSAQGVSRVLTSLYLAR